MDTPSPIAPIFLFITAPAPPAAAGPTTRSTPAGAAPTSAGASCRTNRLLPIVSTVRALTADERDHFVICPKQLASVDRQLMETILSTIASPATRPAYRAQCQNTKNAFTRFLVAKAGALSPSAGLSFESMMESLLLKGLSEVSLTEFNALHHVYTRFNRSLPAHAQLGNPIIAKKLCPVVRCLSESVNTILDVKLVMKGATGNSVLTLATIREVVSDFEAREIRRNIRLISHRAEPLSPNSWASLIRPSRRQHATSINVAPIPLVTHPAKRAKRPPDLVPIDS
eukprot:6184971-Pleurochrysis_carterae.AAC.1